MRSRLSMDRDSGKRISFFLLALALVCSICDEIPKPRAESDSLSLSSPTVSDALRVGNFNPPAGATYTWSASVSNDWTNPLNWSPTRALPAASDILIFGAGTPSPIVTNVAGAVAGVNETIAELHVASGVSPTFSTGGANTLTINAGLGVTGFDVSSLAISGSNALRIELAPGTVGSVTGFMSVAGGSHRLISNDPSGMTFQNNAIFTTSTGFAGNAFGDGSAGNGVAGSIVFAAGSAYFHSAGSSPFGASGNAPVVSFLTGSEADYLTATGFDASGRTYANLIIGNASTAVNASASGTGNFQFDNLTINAAGSNNSSLTFSGSGTSAITIQGNITSNGAGAGTLPDIVLTPGSGGIVINKPGGGTINFGNDLSNSRSIDFEGNASVDANTALMLSRVLQLGFVNPNNKTLTVSGTLNGGAGAYVIGSVLKAFSNSLASNIFEVGTPNGYSPIDVSGVSGTGSLTINVNQSQQPNITGNALKRYWKIASSGGITSADLTFHYLAGDVVGTESNYKIFKYNGSFTQFNPNTLNTTSHFATLNSVTSFSDWTLAEPPPTAATSTVSGRVTDDNGNPVEGAVVRLDGTQSRKTITDSQGNYNFAEVETNGFYTITPSRVNYNFAPSTRGFSALGAHTEASFGATANGGHQNPLDTTEYFVRQQYVDFLNREPEEQGFNDWTDTINNCAPGDTSCDRVHVSEMFFRSEEFQQRGYFVYRFYSTAFGQKPDYAAFAPDLQRVSGFLDATQLEAAKIQFANDFTSRASFVNQYGTLTNAQYVDALSQTAGVTLSNRQALVDSLEAGTLTRAQALRQIAESGEVYAKYYNQAFVVMEYFGYLRRNPDALYLNWIDLLNQGGDSHHMVEGFVDATEYRNRFKQ